jgi:hemerythrin
MALVSWSNEYSVDVRSIDGQHQKLFDMLNELHDSMKVGKGGQTAPGILKQLVVYTCEHFADEECMMLRVGYPELAGHKAEHEKLIGEVQKMVHDFEQGKIVLSMELTDFLVQWLQTHIRGCDKKYSAQMRAAGIS